MSDNQTDSTKYVPDYDYECENCGQVPTVTVEDDGKQTSHFEMCGPCTFGEAACIDPENWN